MRVLLISDIHSNLEALQAVMASAPEHDAVWNLGDVVGYGASPNEVIDQVRPLGNVVVRGNHDKAASGLTDLEDFNPIAARAATWTQAVLQKEQRNWLRNLTAGPISPAGSKASCVHGSPAGEDEYLVTLEDAWVARATAMARITFFGHSHIQGGFATDGKDWFQLAPQYDSGDQAEADTMQLRSGVTYLLNPGSVGQPRDRDWRAAFALYDEARSLLTWHRVPYDIDTAQQRIREAGLPDTLADRLREGR